MVRCTDFVLLKQMLVQLRLYPLVLIVVWAFATINRVYQVFEPHQQVFALYAAQVRKCSIASQLVEEQGKKRQPPLNATV